MISVICPVRNESENIGELIEFVMNSQPSGKEFIIVDGASTDDTKAIIQSYQSKFPGVKLIDNPDKFVPFALNKAIKESVGDPIIRLDAHTRYASDYFERILDCFQTTGADIVGGPMRAVGESTFQKAVAIATSTSFGIGDSSFHDDSFEGFTESVYLGAWKRDIFDTTGYFDTQMLRNQDDEFHYRAKHHGFKIYLDPKIRSWYQPRSTAKSLWNQYFQYGLFKPLVLKKVRSGIKLRHLIPCCFCIYLFTLPVAIFNSVWLVPLMLYLFLNFLFSERYGKKSGFMVIKSMLIVYPILHMSYGLGFLKGLFSVLIGSVPKI